MRIKTFQATTVQEALTLARMELGDDAVVLNTKHAKSPGFLGFGGSGKVELMAAVEDRFTSPPTPPRGGEGSPNSPSRVGRGLVGRFVASVREAEGGAAEAGPEGAARPPVIPNGREESAFRTSETADSSQARNDMGNARHGTEINDLRAELSELRSLVRSIVSPRVETPVLDRPLILRLGVDEDLARTLLPDLMAIDEPSALASGIAARMQAFAQPPVLEGREVIALVGPTGVGKTTTLAKLAARFSLEQGKTVALLTADTYRIGAVDQLRTYARIMGVPLEIAFSPEDMAAAVAKHRDKDVILIDTVGRSQRSAESLEEVRNFVEAGTPTQTHLVISASLSDEVQREAVEKFSIFSPTHLVVTKLDESPTRGCLVNLPLATGLAISCTTAGQSVPQDIDFADAGVIARLVTDAIAIDTQFSVLDDFPRLQMVENRPKHGLSQQTLTEVA